MIDQSNGHTVVSIDRTAAPVVYICSCGARLAPGAMGRHQRSSEPVVTPTR